MSFDIVERVRVRYPTPLGAQHGAFLVDLARTLGGGAGLLAKDYGTFVVLPDGRKVAQDIICYLVSGGATHYDVLGDGEGAAVPTWQDKGPIDPSRYVDVGNAPVPPVPGPTPPPVPQPPAPIPPPACQCKAGDVIEALTTQNLMLLKKFEAVMTAIGRLENDNRKPRPVTGSVGRWNGRINAEVGGVQG